MSSVDPFVANILKDHSAVGWNVVNLLSPNAEKLTRLKSKLNRVLINSLVICSPLTVNLFFCNYKTVDNIKLLNPHDTAESTR